jgi:hypothetical protein
MALNIYSKTFQDVMQDFENLAKTDVEFLQSQELQNKFITQKGLDPEEFAQAYAEYDRAWDRGIRDFRGAQIQFDDDPNLNFAEETVGSLARFGGRTLEELSDFLKLIPGVPDSDRSLARFLPKSWQQYVDPYHGNHIQGDVENIGAQIATFFTPGGLPMQALKGVNKLSKVQRLGKHGDKIRKVAGSKVGKLSAVGAGSALHESIINNDDLDLLEEITSSEEGIKLLERLESNPEDRYAFNLLKNFGINLGIEGGILASGGALVKGYKAFKNTQTGNKIYKLGRKFLATRRGTDDTFLAEEINRNTAAAQASARADGLATTLEQSVKNNDQRAFEIYKSLRGTRPLYAKNLGYEIKNNEDVVSAALRGDEDALKSLSKDTRNVVGDMRSAVDDLSIYLKDNVFQGELAAGIDKNIGAYLNRSYLIFDDGAYRKKLKKAAKNFVDKEKFKYNPGDKALRNKLSEQDRVFADAWHFIKKDFNLVNDEQVAEKFNEFVDIADKDELAAFFGMATKGDSLLGTSRATRKLKNIPKEYRALWGEVKSPYANYVSTYKKLSIMKAEHQFMSDMVPRLEANMLAKKASDLTAKERRGPDKWKSIQDLANDRAAIVFGMRADKKITKALQDKIDALDKKNYEAELFDADAYKEGRISRQQFDENARARRQEMENLKASSLRPLDELLPQSKDMYIAPEYADAIAEFGKDDVNAAFRWWGTAKGISQTTKTVYNPATHARNTIGNMFLLLANGMNPFGGKGSFGKAAKQTMARISGKTDKEMGEQLAEMIEYGIADSSVTLGLIKQNLKRFRNPDDSQMISGLASNKIARVYEGEDYLFKVMHYEKTLDYLKKAHPNMKLEEVKQMAAQRTRDLMPNYQLVPKAFKYLRYSPIGDFVAFPAEMARVTKNLVKYTLDDIFSDNKVLQRAAYKRMAGLTSVSLMPDMMENMSASIYGINTDQQEAIKQIDVPFYMGSPKLFLSGIKQNKRGGKEVDVIRMGPSDPFDSLKVAAKLLHETFLTATEVPDQDKRSILSKKAAIASLDRTISPFVGTSMLTDMLLSLDNNPDLASSFPNTQLGDFARYMTNVFGLPTAVGTTTARIASAFEPGFVTFLKRRSDYEKALEKEKALSGDTGEAYNQYMSPMNFDFFPELLGHGSRPLDLTGSFYRNVGRHLKEQDRLDTNYMGELKRRNQSPEEYITLINNFSDLQDDRKKEATKARAAMEYYHDLGFDLDDMVKGMTMLGNRKSDSEFYNSDEFSRLNSFMINNYNPTKISDQFVEDFLRETGYNYDLLDLLLQQREKFLGSTIENYNRKNLRR